MGGSIVRGMTPGRRLSRDEFHAKVGGFDRADLVKVLWTLYWRGSAPVRERIEDLLEPQAKEARTLARQQPPDAAQVLVRVTEFAALARSGAYLAGDRRVSRQERTRWRTTFRTLAQDSTSALSGDDVRTAVRAVSVLVDLACETKEYDYFRSEDPMEAARFVVSDAVAAMWARLRDTEGAGAMVQQAVRDLVRWERRWGWTRRGDGRVSAQEESLARALAGFLVVPDLWTLAARQYADAVDEVVRKRAGSHRGRSRTELGEDLSQWHSLLVAHLTRSEQDELADRLSAHPALARALRDRPTDA